MDIKEQLMNKIENKENENCVMKQMLDSIRENIKVAQKAQNDKDNEIKNEKELLLEQQ